MATDGGPCGSRCPKKPLQGGAQALPSPSVDFSCARQGSRPCSGDDVVSHPAALAVQDGETGEGTGLRVSPKTPRSTTKIKSYRRQNASERKQQQHKSGAGPVASLVLRGALGVFGDVQRPHAKSSFAPSDQEKSPLCWCSARDFHLPPRPGFTPGHKAGCSRGAPPGSPPGPCTGVCNARGLHTVHRGGQHFAPQHAAGPSPAAARCARGT